MEESKDIMRNIAKELDIKTISGKKPIKYTEEDNLYFTKCDFNSIRNKEHREVRLFCRTLWFSLGFLGRIRFTFTGNYRKAVIKCYDELLKKRDVFDEDKIMREMDRYYGSDLRTKMITLCTNLFSEMRFGYRFLFSITGIHYVPLTQTNKRMIRKSKKRTMKQIKKNKRIIAKQNKKIAMKKKK